MGWGTCGLWEKGEGGGHARGIRRLEERCGLERRLVGSSTKTDLVGDTDVDETQRARAEGMAEDHLCLGARRSSVSFKETENKVARAMEEGVKGEDTVPSGTSRESEQLASKDADKGWGTAGALSPGDAAGNLSGQLLGGVGAAAETPLPPKAGLTEGSSVHQSVKNLPRSATEQRRAQ